MKYLWMVIFALGAIQANAAENLAIECSALSHQTHDGANFLLYPYIYLQKNDGGEIEAMMATDESPESSFAPRLCQLCGWGSAATALKFKGEKVMGGPFAFFDKMGNLVSVGMAETPTQVVESLTCR